MQTKQLTELQPNTLFQFVYDSRFVYVKTANGYRRFLCKGNEKGWIPFENEQTEETWIPAPEDSEVIVGKLHWILPEFEQVPTN